MNGINILEDEIIGRYRLIRKLGEGGMGDVWLAEHTGLKSLFAMKTAAGEKDGILRRQLRVEAERMKTLDDRRIPYLVDMFEDEDRTALVMEYVEGITLEEYLKNNVPLDEEEALGLLKKLCGIVAYLHGCRPQILYRDIKPSNFMIDANGELRLLDFGTALLDTGSLRRDTACGTRGYSAPEQLAGDGGRADADVYSLAAVYSYMLSAADPAKPPFHPLNGDELGRTVSRASKKLIARCLSKDPDRRPANANELLELLEKIRPDRDAILSGAEGHLYHLFLWAEIIAGCVLIKLRCDGAEAAFAESVVLSLSLISLLWGVIRDEMFSGSSFILRRSWNIVLSEKEKTGLYFR